MSDRIEGNGGSKVEIVVHGKWPGYVIITPDRIDKLAEHTPVYLSQALESWQKQNPRCRVRCALPIVENGQTIAIHVWYDQG
jgi:hypothetical protein